MRIDRQYVPQNLVCSFWQRLEWYPHLRAIADNGGLATRHRRALLIVHFDRTERRLELLREPEHHFIRCSSYRVSDPWRGVI